MKILILYGYNKSLLSGFFQELSEKLCTDGFEVDNFYLKHEKASFNQKGVLVYGEERRGFVSNYKAIYKMIKQSKPDVIISNFSYINPAVLFGKLLGVKHNIAWFHTAFGHTKPSQLKVWNKSLYLRMADLVFTNSTSLETEMHQVYKVAKEKTRRVPFWTNINKYISTGKDIKVSPHLEVLNIGCPGRLLEDKNHELVIKALSELKQSSKKHLMLYIAGDGPYKKELQRLVRDLKLEDAVVFLGLLNVEEMSSFYKNMDVVVLPSFHEAFGLVFIEAIALGTPVIVSKMFGALSFLDTQSFPLEDFCFNPEAIQELIDKLEPYLNNNGLTAAYFKRMYDETFEKEVIYKQIKGLILNTHETS
ncbi:glycosyltransferase family 4 protein [Bizionia arctica]|nr:glycosyltransferase family 4 protein [Bizionia arctica]